MASPGHGAATLRADKTESIVRAVFAELADHGWDGLRMDRVAARARVGKPALYRRWASRDAMIVDCLVTVRFESALPTPAGTLRDDLLGWARPAAELLRDPLAGRVIGAVLAAMSTRPELAAAIDDRFRGPRRASTKAALERAIARGEIPATTDVELAIDLLAGPFYMYALGVAGAIPDDYPERLVDAVLSGLAPATV